LTDYIWSKAGLDFPLLLGRPWTRLKGGHIEN
jgi:hypothetical protein